MVNFFVSNAQWVVLIGGVITVLGTMLVSIKSKRSSEANAIEQAKLLSQSITINNMMTGGDSYPMLVISDIDPEFGACLIAVANMGNYPLYLSSMTIRDGDEIQKAMNDPKNMTPTGLDASKILPFTKDYELKELTAHHAQPVGGFPFLFRKDCSFSVTFTARNGSFNQQILVHKKVNGWSIAHRIKTFRENKIVFESIPDDFPKNMLKW